MVHWVLHHWYQFWLCRLNSYHQPSCFLVLLKAPFLKIFVFSKVVTKVICIKSKIICGLKKISLTEIENIMQFFSLWNYVSFQCSVRSKVCMALLRLRKWSLHCSLWSKFKGAIQTLLGTCRRAMQNLLHTWCRDIVSGTWNFSKLPFLFFSKTNSFKTPINQLLNMRVYLVQKWSNSCIW